MPEEGELQHSWKLLVTLMLKMHTFQTLNNSCYASSLIFYWCLFAFNNNVIFIFVLQCVFCATKRVAWLFTQFRKKKNTIDTQWRIWSWQWWLWEFLCLFYSFEFSWKLMWNFEKYITVFQKSGFLAPVSTIPLLKQQILEC